MFEGPATKEVSHVAEQLIVVRWPKISDVCLMRKGFNSGGQFLDFCFEENSSSVCRWSLVMLQKRMLSVNQGWITTSRDGSANAIQLFSVQF